MRCATSSVLVLSLWAAACGGAQPQSEPVAAQPEPEPETQDAAIPVAVEGLWGKIDDSIAEETFSHHFNEFLDCYQREGIDVLEEIEGDLRLFVIVDKDGRATEELYFEDGDLGSDAVQQCLIGVISRIQFPKPVGGYHAKVRYTLPFEAPYEHPAPLEWSDQAQAMAEEHRAEVDACLQGRTGVQLTLYVFRKGRVVAAGATADSLDGYGAGRCLAQAAMGWIFPDPGKGRVAKATVRF